MSNPVESDLTFFKDTLILVNMIKYATVIVADPEGFKGFTQTPLKDRIIKFSWKKFRKIRKNG